MTITDIIGYEGIAHWIFFKVKVSRKNFFWKEAVIIPPCCYSTVVFVLCNTFNPSSTAEEEKNAFRSLI